MARIRIDIQKDGRRGKATKTAIVSAVNMCQEYPNYELKCSAANAITALVDDLNIKAPSEEGGHWYLTFRGSTKAATTAQLKDEEEVKRLLIRMLILAGLVKEKADDSFL